MHDIALIEHLDSLEGVIVAILGFAGVVVKQVLDGRRIKRAEQKSDDAAKQSKVTMERTATLNGGTVGSYTEEMWHQMKDMERVSNQLLEGQKTTLGTLGAIEVRQQVMAGQIEEQSKSIAALDGEVKALKRQE